MPQIEQMLRSALAAVEEAGVPDDLREVAFQKAFDLLAHSEDSHGKDLTQHKADPLVKSSNDWESKVASRLSVDAIPIGEVFEFSKEGDEIGVELIVPTAKLDKSTKAGVKQIALLIATARQAAGIDESATSTDAIKPIATHYGKLDKNFSTHINELEDLFVIKQPKRTEWTLKARAKAFESAGTLIRGMFEEQQ